MLYIITGMHQYLFFFSLPALSRLSLRFIFFFCYQPVCRALPPFLTLCFVLLCCYTFPLFWTAHSFWRKMLSFLSFFAGSCGAMKYVSFHSCVKVAALLATLPADAEEAKMGGKWSSRSTGNLVKQPALSHNLKLHLALLLNIVHVTLQQLVSLKLRQINFNLFPIFLFLLLYCICG